MNFSELLNWIGSITVILATMILSFKTKKSNKLMIFIFSLYWFSNLMWIMVSCLTVNIPLMLSQEILLIINSIGIKKRLN